MVIELRQLEYFVAVAEELHFGRAASRVHVTQPALSEQVRQLEESIGVPLLIRTTRTVRLTGPGRLLLTHARLILAQAAACVQLTRLAFEGKLGDDSVE
jgi:LysR family transcriptional regulator, benzoate and cis,cis-muconate-responsive activator of ben and cat genes